MIREQTFWPMFAISMAWVLLVVSASVVFRLRRGKYLLRPQIPDAIFAETWRSGRSLRNAMTRLGGASGCLWVTVTSDELHVGAHFPFTLMFLPESYGLEHRIEVGRIRAVERVRSLLGAKRVAVRFATRDGKEEALELQLADSDRFMTALAAAKTLHE